MSDPKAVGRRLKAARIEADSDYAPPPGIASQNYVGAPVLGGYTGGGRSSSPGGLHMDGDVSVRGYTRSDGTYVRPHTRHSPGTSPHTRRR